MPTILSMLCTFWIQYNFKNLDFVNIHTFNNTSDHVLSHLQICNIKLCFGFACCFDCVIHHWSQSYWGHPISTKDRQHQGDLYQQYSSFCEMPIVLSGDWMIHHWYVQGDWCIHTLHCGSSNITYWLDPKITTCQHIKCGYQTSNYQKLKYV